MRAKRERRIAAALAAGGLVMILGPLAVFTQAGAAETPSFTGFFNVSAQASGMSVIFGEPGTEPYPVAGGTVPQTHTTLEPGLGYGLSSAAWPGPLIGNAGSLAGLLLPACTPPEVGQCTPPIPAEVIRAGNYPVRAEVSSSGETREEVVGPMRAIASDRSSEARATVTDFDSTGIITSGRVSARSRSFMEDGRIVSVGESTVSDVGIAGGLVQIGSIRSFARAVSDGEQVTIERSMVVSGLEINGQPAHIDEDGLTFGDQESPNPLDPAVEEMNQQMLSHFGMEMFTTSPHEERAEGGEGRVATGSVAIVWDLGDSGQQVLLVLGGASARVQASPGFDMPTFDDGVLGGTFTPPAPPASMAAVQPPPAPAVPGAPPQPAAAPQPQAPVAQPFLDFRGASHFEGIQPGLSVLLVLGALALGAGLRKFRAAALAANTAACVNERV